MPHVNFQFHCSHGLIQGYITKNGLQELHLNSEPDSAVVMPPEENASIAKKLNAALEKYFSGKPESFAGIPLDLAPATAFRLGVWQTAREGVLWGETCGYGDLAKLMGKDRGAARAVGQALGANPVPIIVPCHRILAANGALGGFSCGLEWKRALLRLEGHELG